MVGKVAEVVQLLLTDDNQAAKYIWLSQICNLSSDRNGLIDAFENDKQKTMYPLRDIFRRRYTYSKCSSKHCPLNSLDVNTDEISDVTLHNPDKVDVDDKLSQSIKEWELGTSTKNLVSCKAEFSGEPEHLNYICQKDGDRLVVRCSGWRNPMNLHFVTKPPFLIFDISLLFTNELTHLSCLPYEVSAYGDKYRLGGATSHVSSRAHYVGYVSISNNQFLFYDGLPSQKPILKPCTQTTIHGKISLLIYFPVNEVAMKTDCDAEIICSDTTEKDSVIKNNNSSPKVKKEPIRSTGHVKLRQNPKKKRLSANWFKFCEMMNKNKGDTESSDDDLYFLSVEISLSDT